MAGLRPGHDVAAEKNDVDARHNAGHDDDRERPSPNNNLN
jgi:hypothetical protein